LQDIEIHDWFLPFSGIALHLLATHQS
jgi:hypothetical protein